MSIDPFEIEESTAGTGAACGAIFLDQRFEQLLRTRIGKNVAEVLKPARLEEAMKTFNATIKCNFDPFAEDCDDTFDIRLPGARDIPEIQLNDEYLSLTKFVR